MRSLTRLALLALLGLGACAIHPGRVHQVRFASDAETVLASTQAGVVRGVEGAGVRAFLGVPYARPPVGELRWAGGSAPSTGGEGGGEITRTIRQSLLDIQYGVAEDTRGWMTRLV